MPINVDSGAAVTDAPAPRHRRWITPILALALGVTALIVQSLRGDAGQGLVFLAIMLAYAVVLMLFSKRSETVSLLRGDTSDERADLIQLRAAAVTGYVLILVLVGGFLIELGRGIDSATWSGLCAVGGLTFIASLIVLRRRT